MAFIVGPLYFYKLVFIYTMFSALYSLPEISMPPLNLIMKSEGFEFILSWEPGNNTGTTTYYRVKYKPLSFDCLMHRTPNAMHSKSPERDQVRRAPSNKRSSLHFKIAEECSNITRLFCNLTKEFTKFCQMYLVLVEQFTENGTQMSALQFNPYLQRDSEAAVVTGSNLDACLPPPWFEIAACPNCINVSVKFSSSLLEIYSEFYYAVKLIKEGFTGTPINNSTSKASFYTVVPDLSPNTNYCISVDVSSSVTNQCTPTALKCIVTSSKDKSGLVAFSVVGGILMMVSMMFLLFFLLKAGFVCLRERQPEVLISKPKFSSLLVLLDPNAERIQIIQKGKRKGTEYDYEDDYESDGENDGGYTHNSLLHKISKSSSKADSSKQLSIDSSVASDCQLLGAVDCELDAEDENLLCHTNEEESKTSQTFCSTSELNLTSLPEPEISVCLNINLNTVMVGIPDRNWDADATISSYEEEAADLQELFVSNASDPRHFTERKDMQHSEVHVPSAGSGESESSDSETDCIGEYMRR